MTDQVYLGLHERIWDIMSALRHPPHAIWSTEETGEGIKVSVVYEYRGELGGVNQWETDLAEDLQAHGMIIKGAESRMVHAGTDPQPDTGCNAWCAFTVVAPDTGNCPSSG